VEIVQKRLIDACLDPEPLPIPDPVETGEQRPYVILELGSGAQRMRVRVSLEGDRIFFGLQPISLSARR
jgi:hypothetical protein